MNQYFLLIEKKWDGREEEKFIGRFTRAISKVSFGWKKNTKISFVREEIYFPLYAACSINTSLLSQKKRKSVLQPLTAFLASNPENSQGLSVVTRTQMVLTHDRCRGNQGTRAHTPLPYLYLFDRYTRHVYPWSTSICFTMVHLK